MTESIKNWIDFFRKSHLPTETVERVYAFLIQFTPGSLISINELVQAIDISQNLAIEILTILTDAQLVTLNATCPLCKTPLNNTEVLSGDAIITCSSCFEEISMGTLPAFEILKYAANKDELNKLLYSETYSNEAAEFISLGIKNGFIYYLITDIEGSQQLQRTDVEKYNHYLTYLRKKAWPNSIRKAVKRKLIMFGRGDCIVYAFVDLIDAINVIIGICQQLADIDDLRLSAHIIRIPVQLEDKRYFSLNMEGLWDLNTVSVTDAYRIASYKPKYWENKTGINYKIKLAIIGDAYTLNKDIINSKITGEEEAFNFAPKHGIEYKEICFAGFI